MSKQGQIGLSKKIHVQDLVTIVYVKIVAATNSVIIFVKSLTFLF